MFNTTLDTTNVVAGVFGVAAGVAGPYGAGRPAAASFGLVRRIR